MEIPKSLEPVYSMRVADEPIELYADPFEVDFGDGFQPKDGVIRFEWAPKPLIICHYSGVVSPDDMNRWPVSVKVPGYKGVMRSQVLDFHSTKVKGVFQGQAELVAIETLTRGESSEFSHAIFHIVNLRQFHGEIVETIHTNGSSVGCNRMTLEANNWRVTIDTVHNARELIRSLRRTGGHGITAIGKIERCDGGTFGLEELVEAIEFLSCFLSFMNGDRCSIILPVAYDAEGAEVWRGWNGCLETRWQGKPGWAHDLPAKWVADAFPGFLSRWSNPKWREPLNLAVEWYLQSKRGTIESILLLMQSALESFSWVQFVEDEATDRAGAFANTRASDKIRRILNRYGISLDVPGLLKELKVESHNGNPFQDGPHAITEVRNAIVHQKKEKREAMAGRTLIRDQAARLSLWYVEQLLLNTFDYPHYISPYTLTYPTQDGV